MNIDIKIISELRDKTGAGIGDCKKALEEAGGDINLAIEVLRKKGEIKAAKKSDRATKEGVIAMARADNRLAVAAVACETDFVSRGEEFIATVSEFAQKLLTMDLAAFKDWAEAKIKNELVVKIGENIQLTNFEVIESEVLGQYIHSNKKVAAVVALAGGSEELANEIAMQVVAMSPKYLKPEDIPANEIAKEKEIYTEQLKTEGKPENILEKIIAGKLAKYYEDVCLENQIYIKDETKKVSNLISEAGEGTKIKSFKRFEI